ncbi:MAG: TolC family protein [Chitinophagaceae bacterium]|nr:TolC family protein [Chitinophagaceae bacterium]
MNKEKKNQALRLQHFLIVVLLAVSTHSFAQTANTISIEECYKLAQTNFPLVKQMALIDKTTAYSISNAAKGYLPQFSINGQGTYQSDVTSLSIPGVNTTTLSKDQYKVYGEVTQSLTDFGIIRQQKELAKTNAETEKQKIEVELYKLKERINQIYFGILLIDAQIEQTELLKKDIQNGIDKTNAAIANGTALKSNADNLKAELLKTDQRTIELKANRKGYTDMLALFIAKDVTENTKLITPVTQVILPTINRPELKMYETQKKSYDIQNKLITARNLPKVGLFFQGGYGRPGLNQLSNVFATYYIGGLKLNWNFGGLYNARNDRSLLKLNKQTIDVQKEVFLFNTNLSLSQQNSEVDKFLKLIGTDNEIIQLRNKVKSTAQAQLQNGVITTNDYLTYVNAEDQARQNLLLHQVQLSLAQYNYQTTSGN